MKYKFYFTKVLQFTNNKEIVLPAWQVVFSEITGERLKSIENIVKHV